MDPVTKEGRIGIRRRVRRERRRMVAGELMQDFAQNTTLHGLRYIAERRLSLTEKLFWIASFLISLSLCVILIWNVWVKWRTSPVIVTFSEQLVSVGEVPFPSVTICPQLKMKRSAYNDSIFHEITNLTSKTNWTQEELNILQKHEDLTNLCFHQVNYQRNYSDAKIIEHIFEVSPTVNDVFHNCLWREVAVPCAELFQPVLTMEGVCFTMNSLAAKEIFRVENLQKNYSYMNTSTASKGWSPSGDYSTSDADAYPKRGRSNGVRPDFTVFLKEDPLEWSKNCRTYNSGYKLYLHHPADVPQYSLYYFSAHYDQTVSFALIISVLNTSVTLKSYPPEIRQCFFSDERYLRYFIAYTPDNCRLECLSNYTFHQCGCVMFHMPHYNDSTICRSGKNGCVVSALESFAAEEGHPDTEVERCQCYPLCNGVQYDADTLKTRFDFDRYLEAASPTQLASRIKYTHLEFYHKEPRFVSMRRSELFGLTDFMANCGGLLGLFLGFSFLSLVEIFYFCTLRLGCTFRREMKKEDSTTSKIGNRY